MPDLVNDTMRTIAASAIASPEPPRILNQDGAQHPPDRAGRVAQLTVTHENEIDIPAEVLRDGEHLMITLSSRSDGTSWTCPLADFVAAVEAAAAAVEAPTPEN
jgi:hypothetical protein